MVRGEGTARQEMDGRYLSDPIADQDRSWVERVGFYQSDDPGQTAETFI